MVYPCRTHEAEDMISLQLAVLAVVIGSNNFAAGLAFGAVGREARRARIIAIFGLFEFVIPLVGVWLGRSLAERIAQQANWLGPSLLVALGLVVVVQGLRKHDRRDAQLAQAVTTWRGLFLLAATLSIDNLIVGFSLGLKHISPLTAATTIAVCSMLFTWLGIRLGHQLRKEWQQRAEMGSGALLALVGVLGLVGWL